MSYKNTAVRCSLAAAQSTFIRHPYISRSGPVVAYRVVVKRRDTYDVATYLR